MAAVLATAAALCFACGRRTPPRNLLVVLSDTHRADYAAPWLDGAGRPTPNVELLARDGVRFTEAYTPVPISAPAYASLFTGLPPLAHGLLNNSQSLRGDLPTLAERLREAGYATAAVVANPYCGERYGFGRGFDSFWDEVEGRGKEGRHVTAAAIEWLDARPADRPFFLFAAYMDAHTPYLSEAVPPSLLLRQDGEPLGLLNPEDPHRLSRIPLRLAPGTTTLTFDYLEALRPAEPADEPSPLRVADLRLNEPRLELRLATGWTPEEGAPSRRRMANRATLEIVNPDLAERRAELSFRAGRLYRGDEQRRYYLAGIRAFDRAFGELLAFLESRNLYKDTIVVFLSDHGEMLGEHGRWGHVHDLYQQTLRIPLVVKSPGLPRGKTGDGRLLLTDVHRLLLGLTVGVEEGAHRFPFLDNDPLRPLVAATYPPEAERLRIVLLRDHLKLMTDGESHALYDLRERPEEIQNRFAERAEEPEAQQLLAAALGELRRRPAEAFDVKTLSEGEQERLRALGYLE